MSNSDKVIESGSNAELMKPVALFLAKHPPRKVVKRSCLFGHIQEIKQLRLAGCSLREICDFLKEYGASVTQSTLRSYIMRAAHGDTKILKTFLKGADLDHDLEEFDVAIARLEKLEQIELLKFNNDNVVPIKQEPTKAKVFATDVLNEEIAASRKPASGKLNYQVTPEDLLPADPSKARQIETEQKVEPVTVGPLKPRKASFTKDLQEDPLLVVNPSTYDFKGLPRAKSPEELDAFVKSQLVAADKKNEK